jgi:hypothetical protein
MIRWGQWSRRVLNRGLPDQGVLPSVPEKRCNHPGTPCQFSMFVSKIPCSMYLFTLLLYKSGIVWLRCAQRQVDA